MHWRRVVAGSGVLVAALAVGCGDDGATPSGDGDGDGAAIDGGIDATAIDGGHDGSSSSDAGDAIVNDSSASDAAASDAGASDADASDAGANDAGASDANAHDAAASDASDAGSTTDAQSSDAATADAAEAGVDAGCVSGRYAFLPGVSYGAGFNGNAVSVAVGNLNGDAFPDIAVVGTPASSRSVANVYVNSGTGTFSAPTTYYTGSSPTSIAIGDLDGDGFGDLAIANYDYAGTGVTPNPLDDGGFPYTSAMSVLVNKHDATFFQQVPYASFIYPTSIALGDLDGDHVTDVALAVTVSNTATTYKNLGGTFGPQVTHATASPGVANTYSIALADLDGDGDLDMAVANVNSKAIGIFVNAGNGTFAAQVSYPAGTGSPTYQNPRSVSLGDVDGDGDIDVVSYEIATGSASIGVLLNAGNATFGAQTLYATTGNALNAGSWQGDFRVAIGDFDGDGHVDLAAPNYSDDSIGIFLGAGNGTFGSQVRLAGNAFPTSVVAADVNGDGHLDLVASNLGGTSTSPSLSTISVFLAHCQ